MSNCNNGLAVVGQTFHFGVLPRPIEENLELIYDPSHCLQPSTIHTECQRYGHYKALKSEQCQIGRWPNRRICSAYKSNRDEILTLHFAPFQKFLDINIAKLGVAAEGSICDYMFLLYAYSLSFAFAKSMLCVENPERKILSLLLENEGQQDRIGKASCETILHEEQLFSRSLRSPR
jgi:hypothetical protein